MLRAVWRDTVVSPQMTWDAPVYERIFRTVRDVNLAAEARDSPRLLRVLAGDPPIDWSTIHNLGQLRAVHQDPTLDRDAHFAAVVEQEVLRKGRRALLVAGSGHLARRNLWTSPAPNPSPDTVTVRLLRIEPDSVHVISTLSSRILEHQDLLARLEGAAVPSLFPLKGHWLGEWPASDFAGVRRYHVQGPGKWPFEGFSFSQVADSALFLGTRFTDSLPPFDYQDEAYREELNRRRRILGAPERTRWVDAIAQVEDLRDAGRLAEAIEAAKTIQTWASGSAHQNESLRRLRDQLDELARQGAEAPAPVR